MIFPEEDRSSIAHRFSEKYIPEPNSGCWLWEASMKGNGYGQIQLRHRRGLGPEFSHRVSYELHCGEIPDGMIVLHSCDNRACVNPDHLSVGTVADNVRDMMRKSRGRGQYNRGDDCKHAKLSDADVAKIRSSKLSSRRFAADYRVSERHILHIRAGERRTIEKVAQIFKK